MFVNRTAVRGVRTKMLGATSALPRRYRRTDFVGATAQTIIGVLKVVLAAGAGENRRLNACRRNQIG